MSSSRRYVLALDEGSSSARSLLIDEWGTIVSDAFAPVVWERPRSGWVELDPRRLWETQLDTIHRAMASGGIRASEIAACGVTTHRETVMIWDRRTGEPVHNAIVWLSSQTDDIIARWQAEGMDQEFRRRTGLRNDSFFSAGKLAWLLDEVPGLRPRAEAGHLSVRNRRLLVGVVPDRRRLAPDRSLVRLTDRALQPRDPEMG